MKEFNLRLLIIQIETCIRIILYTIFVCCIIYPLVILCIGQGITPYTANGWLIKASDGRIMGSEILSQGFTNPKYFHPRPSAVDYNAAGSGGSNLSPTNPLLKERAVKLIQHWGANLDNPIPSDLVTASGSGLDPHISLDAALYQIPRIARTRSISEEKVLAILKKKNVPQFDLLKLKLIINVLMLNIELEQTQIEKR
jgi:potassium-transporting ATPase KdpC subunit